jgi:hypothetical protein
MHAYAEYVTISDRSVDGDESGLDGQGGEAVGQTRRLRPEGGVIGYFTDHSSGPDSSGAYSYSSGT